MAFAPDGVVEGLEWAGDDWWMAGVQWHPEVFEDRDERTRRLFRAFVDAARGA